MNVGAASQAVNQIASSILKLNDMNQKIVDTSQNMDKKMVNLNVVQKLNALTTGEIGSTLNIQA